jgi:hypothetical protein
VSELRSEGQGWTLDIPDKMRYSTNKRSGEGARPRAQVEERLLKGPDFYRRPGDGLRVGKTVLQGPCGEPWAPHAAGLPAGSECRQADCGQKEDLAAPFGLRRPGPGNLAPGP